MTLPIITFIFHGELKKLLKSTNQYGVVRYNLRRRASLKDILESLNVPHTEIGLIIHQEKEVDFSYIPREAQTIHIYPMTGAVIRSLPNLLWPERWLFDRFMVDINALKLARNMRMAGIDTAIVPEMSVVDTGIIAANENRVVLTRNRQLLKCAEIIYGQLLSSENHIEQLREVNSRFALKNLLKPFSRCLNCNGQLQSVAKSTIEHLLEPLTKKFYTDFKRCEYCRDIYWRGSHVHHMEAMLAEIDWS